MRLPALLSVAALAVLACGPASASPSRCPTMFLGGEAPDLLTEALKTRTTELCYTSFATMNSGLTRTSIWSAERLTRDQVRNARGLERENSFHADPNVPFADRAELSDYAHSGFDRGHMSPNGDMPDVRSQGESFTLANMIPQNPENNRHLWAAIESSVRDLTLRDGEVFVVTGPIFSGATIDSLKGRVLVPTQVFKAVYSSAKNAAGVYLAANAPGSEWKAISLNQLRRIANVDAFPALPDSVKDAVMDLPGPSDRRGGGRGASRGDGPGATGGILHYFGLR